MPVSRVVFSSCLGSYMCVSLYLCLHPSIHDASNFSELTFPLMLLVGVVYASVSGKSDPVVCRLMDFKKEEYRAQRLKKAVARRVQKKKEIRFKVCVLERGGFKRKSYQAVSRSCWDRLIFKTIIRGVDCAICCVCCLPLLLLFLCFRV